MRREIVKYNGITYRLDAKSFFYEPIDPEDEHYPYPGLVILALAIACWGLVIGIGWCVYRIIEILVS